MLCNKSDALQIFKNYKCKVKTLTGKRINKLRTDNGKEYMSKEFSNFLGEEGITRQLSVRYTPQKNSVAGTSHSNACGDGCMYYVTGKSSKINVGQGTKHGNIGNRSATKNLSLKDAD